MTKEPSYQSQKPENKTRINKEICIFHLLIYYDVREQNKSV